MASNESTLTDEYDEYDDWLELYNSSSTAQDISGFYLSDDYDYLDKWQFPDDTIVPANGYLIVWIDDDEETQGPLHAGFKLSADGDNIIISDATLTILDEISFGDQFTDISMGRYPNGTGNYFFMNPTPLLTNVKQLVINEFMASNETTLADEYGEYDDWLELYNLGSTNLDLSDYYLSDDASVPDKWQFPDDTSIAAGSFLLVWLDGDGSTQGPLHTTFSLSIQGEELLLSDNNLAVIEYYSFETQTTDISTGRYPNGLGNYILMSPTPGAENLSGVPVFSEEVPASVSKLINYPNPFNPTTTISFCIELEEQFELIIYNIQGERIRNFSNHFITQSGNHSIVWDGTDQNGNQVASGIYFYKLKVGKEELVNKMLLLK